MTKGVDSVLQLRKGQRPPNHQKQRNGVLNVFNVSFSGGKSHNRVWEKVEAEAGFKQRPLVLALPAKRPVSPVLGLSLLLLPSLERVCPVGQTSSVPKKLDRLKIIRCESQAFGESTGSAPHCSKAGRDPGLSTAG